MKQLDLFAGIGGISLAAEWAGIETVAFCEKEPFAQGILRRQFPGRPIYDDVFNLTREVLKRDGITGIDIVAGGFPCQPFSHAGKRTGTADDRYLWPEMCRIVGELRPSWVFAENVDGLVSMAQSGGDIVMEDEATLCKEAEMVVETIRKDLEAIGYRSIPVIIPACDVGASHRRYRIFILGYSASAGLPQRGRPERIESGPEARAGTEHGPERPNESVADPNKQHGDDGRYDTGQILGQRSATSFLSRGEALADSASERCGEAREHSGRSSEWSPGGSTDVADAAGWRRPGSRESFESGNSAKNRTGQANKPVDVRFGAEWSAQPGMGRGTYELSDWLDGWGMNPLDALFNFIASYPQPALMGMPQHAWEPPRVATGVKYRAARIKALGNAVDPLQALPVLYAIRVIHEYMMKGGSL